MKKIWFKRKLYGWGWYPVTWEGWLVTAIYVLAILSFAYTAPEMFTIRDWIFSFILPFSLLTIIFVQIAYKYGERPRWQWGRRKDD